MWNLVYKDAESLALPACEMYREGELVYKSFESLVLLKARPREMQLMDLKGSMMNSKHVKDRTLD